MLENEWLYDRAYENGMKEGIKRGKALAYKEVLNILPQEYEIKECDFCDYSRIDSVITEINQLADNCSGLEASDLIPSEDLVSSRLFHHIRAYKLETFYKDFVGRITNPLFLVIEFIKYLRDILSKCTFTEEETKYLPKTKQIYYYALVDSIRFFLRKLETLNAKQEFPKIDLDVEIVLYEITLEIQMARLTSLRIKDDQKP